MYFARAKFYCQHSLADGNWHTCTREKTLNESKTEKQYKHFSKCEISACKSQQSLYALLLIIY